MQGSKSVTKASGLHWITVVPETKSADSRDKERRKFNHYFTVDYDDNKPIKLLRIDIWDNFYLDDFSLIYLDPKENLKKGKQVRSQFHSTFVFPPRKGEYKIKTMGGSYKYRVRLLEYSGWWITPQPIVENSYKARVQLPIKDKPFKVRYAHRKLGSDQWEFYLYDYFSTKGNLVLDVDPEHYYEVKAQLFIDELFETEYSEPVTIEDHKIWLDKFYSNDASFLVYHALRFEIPFCDWPTGKDLILRIKLNDADWISFEKLYNHQRDHVDRSEPIVFDISNNIYDELSDDETQVEWKLVLRDQVTKKEHEAGSRLETFAKREKFRGSELIDRTMIFTEDEGIANLYLCRNGVFKIERSCYGYGEPILGGNYQLKPLNNKTTTDLEIVFAPVRKLKEPDGDDADNDDFNIDDSIYHPIWSLPDLAKQIFKFVFSLNENNEDDYTLISLIEINLVCKQWYNTFWQSFELNGQFNNEEEITIFGWKREDSNTGIFNRLLDSE